MGKPTKVIPVNWPTALPYLVEPFHSSHLTKSQLQALCTRSDDLDTEIRKTLPKGASTFVRITSISDPSHPAHGQAGLFATGHLPPGSLILPYLGVVHSSEPPHCEEHEKSDYELWLDREAGLAVDAEKAGNEARFVNDYRGIRDRPNAEFRECWDSRFGQKCMAIFVLPAAKNAQVKKAAVGIAKGEEICVSYGKGFWGKRKAEEELT